MNMPPDSFHGLFISLKRSGLALRVPTTDAVAMGRAVGIKGMYRLIHQIDPLALIPTWVAAFVFPSHHNSTPFSVSFMARVDI